MTTEYDMTTAVNFEKSEIAKSVANQFQTNGIKTEAGTQPTQEPVKIEPTPVVLIADLTLEEVQKRVHLATGIDSLDSGLFNLEDGYRRSVFTMEWVMGKMVSGLLDSVPDLTTDFDSTIQLFHARCNEVLTWFGLEAEMSLAFDEATSTIICTIATWDIIVGREHGTQDYHYPISIQSK